MWDTVVDEFLANGAWTDNVPTQSSISSGIQSKEPSIAVSLRLDNRRLLKFIFGV
jgi:hypothetical protein